MYLLMNKNKILAAVENTGIIDERFEIKETFSDLPFGINKIDQWIENRKATKHNAHLREIMNQCGGATKSGFINITHAASLNDSLWIKSDQENIEWNDVSLYRNEFNEVISKLAYEGVGLYGIKFSDTSPELSTEGSFRKCWRRENGEIFLYKRGTSEYRNAGLEPYCEMLTSELAKYLCNTSVSYDLVNFHGDIATRCKLFTDEEIGYIPIAKYVEDGSVDALLEFYAKQNSEDDFRRMVTLDCITFNVDRHMGNHGMYINNDTFKPIKMAPVFDFNLALLPYVFEDEFNDIGKALNRYEPRIGNDFTRIGQLILTSDIKSDLINLKGFEFSFRGDERFPIKRVKNLEKLINAQITGLLSKDKLFTKDVFVPKEKSLQNTLEDKDEHKQNEMTFIEHLKQKLENRGYENILINENENGETELLISPKADPEITFVVNGSDGSILIERNDDPIALEALILEHNAAFNLYNQISKDVDNLMDQDISKINNREVER